MIRYRVDIADLHSHHFEVTVTVLQPDGQQTVSLPVWIPGSYMVREFARHLSGLQASQGGRPIQPRQLDKTRWLLDCQGARALTLRYRVYAFDPSVRAAFLDSRRGFFNGTSLLLRVHGREAQVQRLRIGKLPAQWQIATAMAPRAGSAVEFEAADYDELVDHPVELGAFWRGQFQAGGVPHQFVVAGALPGFDGQRLLADSQRICEAAIAFWHGQAGGPPPMSRYLFLLNAVEDGYGGLEHRASTALIAARRDLPRLAGDAKPQAMSDSQATLLGLICHEYFHSWNVKRLKPAEFTRIDYSGENYTALLWFFEGFTSYYDDLLLRRAGLIDAPRYLKLLAKAMAAVAATPGRQLQSVAEASFDAWNKYYRADENTPNATVSYYQKGSLVALALDLSLRRAGGSLDEVMRALWQQTGGGPISEADIAAALQAAGKRSFAPELAAWVHGRGELPLAGLLAEFGVVCGQERAGLAASLGLRLAEGPVSGITVRGVLAGSAAAVAGVSAGDELLAIDGWRLRRLDDALAWLRPGASFELLAVRDQRITHLRIQPQPAGALAQLPTLSLLDRPGKAMRDRRMAWIAA